MRSNRRRGYIETGRWPRLLRDAQVSTIWEGPDNIACVWMCGAGSGADARSRALLARLCAMRCRCPTTDSAAGLAPREDSAITAPDQTRQALAEGAAVPAGPIRGRRHAGVVEQAAWERAARGTDRKGFVRHAARAPIVSPTKARCAVSTQIAMRRRSVRQARGGRPFTAERRRKAPNSLALLTLPWVGLLF